MAGRPAAARPLLACIVISAATVVPAALLILVVARESADAYTSLQQLLQSPQANERLRLLQLRLSDQDVHSTLLEWLRRVSEFLLSTSSQILAGFAEFVVGFFLMLITLYFFFLDGMRLVREIKALLPLREEHAQTLLRQFRDVSTATLYGTLLTGLSQGFAGALTFALLGLPAAGFWGAVMGVASFIPLIGSGLVWAPAALYLLLSGAVGTGVGFISGIDNVVRLLVLKGSIRRMHLLMMFLSILGGLKVFGVLGLILGPLIAALFQACLEIYKTEFVRTRAGTPAS